MNKCTMLDIYLTNIVLGEGATEIKDMVYVLDLKIEQAVADCCMQSDEHRAHARAEHGLLVDLRRGLHDSGSRDKRTKEISPELFTSKRNLKTRRTQPEKEGEEEDSRQMESFGEGKQEREERACHMPRFG